MKLQSKKLYLGAMMLGIGTFIAKILGAFYRIPLTSLIGGSGMGLYQMVFPVYTILLEFSGVGAPNAIAKMISSEKEDKEYRAIETLVASKKLFFILGLIASLIMAIFSFTFSKLQGNVNARLSYIALSPAIIAVSIISCYRGYFQGLLNMTPTAISQVVEQVIKISVGLLLAKLLMPNIPLAVSGTVLAITVSEFFTLLVLYAIYKKRIKNLSFNFIYDNGKLKSLWIKIIKYAFPVTLIGVMIPLSQLIDSFIIINRLNYLDDATALFGLFSGVAVTVVNLPVSVCYGVAVASLPSISSSVNKEERKRNIINSITLTLLLTVPACFVCFYFAPTIVNILFKSLPQYERDISIKLIKIISPSVAFLSLLQTTNSVLIAKGRLYIPVISMLISILVKVFIEFSLIIKPEFNIYGSGLALIACYFFADLLNLIAIAFIKDKNGDKRNCRQRKTA